MFTLVSLLALGLAGAQSNEKKYEFCALSRKESNNFICESDNSWNTRKKIFIEQQRRQKTTGTQHETHGPSFFQRNWEPNFNCHHDVRIGNPGDGGKWACNIHAVRRHYENNPSEKCVVYSLGSNNQFDFEEAIHEVLPMCEIHTFDHTVQNPTPPSFVQYHRWGLGPEDAEPILTLETIRKKLGHEDQIIEILKIDIEGAEYAAITPLLEGHKLGKIRQWLMELHYRHERGQAEQHRIFEAFTNDQWVIFHKEPNIQYGGGHAVEYGFLKLNWDVQALQREVDKVKCTGGWHGINPVCGAWTRSRRRLVERIMAFFGAEGKGEEEEEAFSAAHASDFENSGSVSRKMLRDS